MTLFVVVLREASREHALAARRTASKHRVVPSVLPSQVDDVTVFASPSIDKILASVLCPGENPSRIIHASFLRDDSCLRDDDGSGWRPAGAIALVSVLAIALELGVDLSLVLCK